MHQNSYLMYCLSNWKAVVYQSLLSKYKTKINNFPNLRRMAKLSMLMKKRENIVKTPVPTPSVQPPSPPSPPIRKVSPKKQLFIEHPIVYKAKHDVVYHYDNGSLRAST